jgi:hypothetical protein
MRDHDPDGEYCEAAWWTTPRSEIGLSQACESADEDGERCDRLRSLVIQ